MTLPLYILSAVGFTAVLWRLARTLVRAARRGVDGFIAGELAKTRAQRGDVTGMEEASKSSRRARRDRWRWGLESGLWLAALVLPPVLLDSPLLVYAAYSLVWPLSRVLTRRTPSYPPQS